MVPETRLQVDFRISNGFQMRKDWLDKLQLKVPETIDEWYTVLKAFKEKDPNGNGKADEIPFIATKKIEFQDFLTAFGLIPGFYVDNGKIKNSVVDPKYKEFVITMNKRYSEGLIDPEYLSMNNKNFDAKVTGNIAGSYNGSLSNNMGRYSNMMACKDPKFKLVGAPNPKSSDGKVYGTSGMLVKWAPHGASLGKNIKNPIEAIKWLDYHFSDEGRTLFNWGIEGRSFITKDGKRQFTDLVLKNPEGFTVEQAACRYAGGVISQMPGISDIEVPGLLKLGLPQQKAASDLWPAASNDKLIPPTTLTTQETTSYSTIVNEINTYQNEMLNKFIMGKEPLSNLDKFAETINRMKIDEAIKLQQAAYDRYMARK